MEGKSFIPQSKHVSAPKRVSFLRRFLRVFFICVSVSALIAGGVYLGRYIFPHEERAPVVMVEGVNGEPIALSYGEQPVLAESNFFERVKSEFIESKNTFIEADLAAMKVNVYEEGVIVKEVPILTKGKEGSWWETPAGIYKIESKETEHFSSFGNVYQPWSMAFQGNFFIHGWPYYPGGTPVASQFSGGCIRLSNEDAKAIYDLVSIGTPVLVHEQDFGSDGFSYSRYEPNVTATGYLIADIESGVILSERGGEDVVSVASIVKLMTALVAAEYINLDKDIFITPNMIASTSIPRLSSGTSTPAYGLLFPLLRESSNEAAEVFAQESNRARFISRMNAKAEAIGMSRSRFTDPAGVEAANVSTVRDLFSLARYLYNNRSFILKITSGDPVNTLYTEPTFTNLQNFNIVPGTNRFVGGKVGKSTSAGETGLYLYRGTVKGEERVIALIVLGSKDRNADVLGLMEYARSQYGIVF